MNRSVKELETPIRVCSTVIKGHQRGRKLGFKTANLDTNTDIQIEHGIYFGWALLFKKIYSAAISFGKAPSFDNVEATLEVHLCNVDLDDFYGSEMKVVICGSLRGMVKIEWYELVSTITDDIEIITKALGTKVFAKYAEDDFLTNT